MSEVKSFAAGEVGPHLEVVFVSDFDAVTRLFLDAAERCVASERREKELQQRLTSADERVDVLEGLSVKQAALLDELGIPLDEVDDLFGETLKNAKRYEYLRSVMAVESFPNQHPDWSEPSEVESKRIDDLCDAALKPAKGAPSPACTWSEGGFSWHTSCGKEWQFTDGGLPSENGMHFCHSCGKALVIEIAEGGGDEN